MQWKGRRHWLAVTHGFPVFGQLSALSVLHRAALVQMIRHSSDVYSLGGYTYGATAKVYRLREGAWSAVPSMAKARYVFAAALHNHTIFVFGGVGATTSLASVEAFDTTAQRWTSKAQLPTGAQLYSQVQVRSIHGAMKEGAEKAMIDSQSTYRVVDKPCAMRGHPVQAAVVYRDVLWLCGGWAVPASAACFTYDPRRDVWSPAASMTTSRYLFGLVVLGDFIYAIGGPMASSAKSAERYNPSNQTWEPLPGQLANSAFHAVIIAS